MEFDAFKSRVQLRCKVCTDGPMVNLEILSDALSVDEYIAETVRAENSAWSNASAAELPQINLDMIEDEDIRKKVL